MNKSYKITIYTSDNCAFCHAAKEIFKEKKLQFEEINIFNSDISQKMTPKKSEKTKEEVKKSILH